MMDVLAPTRLRLTLLLAGLLSSCSSSGRPGHLTGSEAECTSDEACPVGEGCLLPVGRCAALARSPVALEVLPPANDRGWVRQEYARASASREGRIVLQLDAGARLKGRIQPSHDREAAVPAQVIATRPSLIDGRAPVSFETTAQTTARAGQTSYELWVNPGYRYVLQVLPNPPNDRSQPCAERASCVPSYPITVFPDVEVPGSTERDLVLEGEDRSLEVTGRVLDAAGQPLDFPVQVRATAEDGNQSTIGITCSSSTADQCSCGSPACYGDFRIRVSGHKKVYALRIDSYRPAGSRALIPSLECSGLVLGEISHLAEPIRLPAFPRPVEYQARVLGLEDVETPVVQAQVTFVTASLSFSRTPSGFDACEASYQRSALTDAEGRATLALLPGDEVNRLYDLTIETPPKSPYANARVVGYEIGPQGGALAPFRLSRRDIVSGTVLDPSEQGVANALIEAREIAPDDAPLGRPAASAVTETDEEGAFALPITRGIYNLQVHPPPERGLPVLSVHALPVAGPVDGLVFKLPKPALLLGDVLLADRSAAANFTVQFYDLVPETGEGKVHQAQARTATFTDARGRFRMVVSSP